MSHQELSFMQVTVTKESICKANSLFWEPMLSMHVEPISPSLDAEARCIGTEHILGSCDLSGVWSGRIEVRLTRGLAILATAAMLMQPPDSVLLSDIMDAAREIANMIAGTIKSVLPRPCSMTVPSAGIEPADFCILPRTGDSVTVFFHHAAGELMVRVWECTVEPKSEIGESAQFFV
jgi:hypothetical protein